MTTLEARVTALEQDVAVLLLAIQQISTTQTLYTSVATAQMLGIATQIRQLMTDIRGDWCSDDDD